jgi:hypothetical protein
MVPLKLPNQLVELPSSGIPHPAPQLSQPTFNILFLHFLHLVLQHPDLTTEAVIKFAIST